MILIIDNYDSFTYNLFQMIGEIVQELSGDISIVNPSYLHNKEFDDKKDNKFHLDNHLDNQRDKNRFRKLLEVMVIRNDEMSLNEIKDLKPSKIIISPGPGNPVNERDFGICQSIIKELGKEIPILGVCLGHQGIFSTFGGKIIKQEPVHGKQCELFHEGEGIFYNVPNPLIAARYHSLTCDQHNIPECIEITSKTEDNIIMSLKHKDDPIFGLQFHPESIGTADGQKIIKNFLVMDL